MKKSILLLIVSFVVFTSAVRGQSSFTRKDRDLLIELKIRITEIDKRFDQMDKRFDQIDKRFAQVDKRFEELRTDTNKRFEELRADTNKRFEQLISFIYILAGIFGAMTVITIGFALWDRKTMIRPFETKVKEIEKEIATNRETNQKINCITID
jgi:predicted PurR-regulated permease PerM